VRQKTKGRRELLNWKSSINYDDALLAFERQGSHDVLLSTSCRSWVLGSSGFVGFLFFGWFGFSNVYYFCT
jgi:hypothetical protein